ncbi:MAG: hypothetical protein ACKOAI_01945 [Acidimicrobiia bacterium]
MTNAVRASATRRAPDPWLNVVRIGWLAAALLPDSLSTSGATLAAAVIVWAAWVSVALGVLVAHPLSLTVVRFVAPLVVVHAFVSSVDDGASAWQIAGVIVMFTSALVAFSSRYGAPHAQAAAYGHESRHLLRPPVAVLLPLCVLWLATASCLAVAVRAESEVLTIAGAFLGSAVCAFAVRRALVLARRWLVFVPAGIAVHDPLVLRDTFMVRQHDVRALHPAPADTQAFDATCTTWGVPLELVLAHPHDVALSQFGTRVSRTLDRLHVTALLVAPSLSQRAIADLRA